MAKSKPAEAPPEPKPEAAEPNGNGGQKPVKVFSYPVAKDTYVQASV